MGIGNELQLALDTTAYTVVDELLKAFGFEMDEVRPKSLNHATERAPPIAELEAVKLNVA